MKILYRPHYYSQQRQRDKKVWVYPIHLAMEATYEKNRGHEVYWGESSQAHDYDKLITEPEGLPFLSLPAADRLLTGAFDRRYQRNGNFKYTPGTYLLSAKGCWHGKCSFCVEREQKYEIRPIGSVVEEINQCKALGFKEIFDDSATFPTGEWLHSFCKWSPRDVTLGCNMRICDVDFAMMKQAGFRMMLFGVESANQKTLDRLNKGIKSYDIIPTIKKAAQAGLEPHGAIMVGYPWETLEEEMNTINLVKDLLIKGYLKTAQVSIYDVPFQKPIDRGTKNKIFEVGFSPIFWINKAKDIRRWQDFLYLIRGIKEGVLAYVR